MNLTKRCIGQAGERGVIRRQTMQKFQITPNVGVGPIKLGMAKGKKEGSPIKRFDQVTHAAPRHLVVVYLKPLDYLNSLRSFVD